MRPNSPRPSTGKDALAGAGQRRDRFAVVEAREQIGEEEADESTAPQSPFIHATHRPGAWGGVGGGAGAGGAGGGAGGGGGGGGGGG